MAKITSEDAVVKATGRRIAEWFSLIKQNDFADADHKTIAAYLSKQVGVSFWWAQELTVLYEKHIGRRVTGQTKDAGFQLGVNKTVPFSKTDVWKAIISKKGMEQIVGDVPNSAMPENIQGTSKTGLEYEITTFKPNSHFRMKYKKPEWQSHSILQVRVTDKAPQKTQVTFHHEKLPDKSAREQMKLYWEDKINALLELL